MCIRDRDGSTDDLIDAYVAPENYAQEGTPVREGKGGFTAVANGSTLFSSKYTRLGWNADTQVYSWNNAGNDVISGMKQGAMVPIFSATLSCIWRVTWV